MQSWVPLPLKWTIRDSGHPTQDHVLGNSQPSLRDWSLALVNSGPTSWATISRPYGTQSVSDLDVSQIPASATRRPSSGHNRPSSLSDAWLVRPPAVRHALLAVFLSSAALQKRGTAVCAPW